MEATMAKRGVDQQDLVNAAMTEDDGDEALEKRLRERLANFEGTLVARRIEAVQYRAASGMELRWIEDTANYLGAEEFTQRMDVVQQAGRDPRMASANRDRDEKVLQRATLHVHLTRAKTNAAAARVSDMLFPSDDRNWSCQPTPVPMLAKAVREHMDTPYVVPGTQRADGTGGMTLPHPQTGQPLTLGQLAQDALNTANEKCEGMIKEIDDCLTECGYNYEGRKVIANAARLGVGIMKGPMVVNRIHRKWVKAVGTRGEAYRRMEAVSETKPMSVSVDPWNFYPDPGCGDNIQNGEYIWERDYASTRRLKALARIPGYLAEQIQQCLAEGPQHATEWSSYDSMRRASQLNNVTTQFENSRFELWSYVGTVSTDDLIACGMSSFPADDRTGEVLKDYMAVVVMCNSHVIYADVVPQDTGDFPYDVFVWEPVENSWAGVGIPYLMRYSQRTVNAAWRAMLDNMACSYGPQIIMKDGVVRPYDGKWEIVGRKLWLADEDCEDVQKAFWQFEFDSNQEPLEAIINLAMKFADEETSMPQIAQGEQGTAPDTVGGMTLLMNSANVVLRRLVRQFDDQVTRPHITRYYDWMMQYSENDDIKGDFSVDARGSTYLLMRDEQRQGITNLLAAATHPIYGKFINAKKLFTESLRLSHILPQDVMNTDAEITEIEKQPPPKSEKIQVAEIQAQGAAQAQQIEAESEQANLKLKEQIAANENAYDLRELEMRHQLALLEYANKNQVTLDQIKASMIELTMKQAHDVTMATLNTRKETASLQQMQSQPPGKDSAKSKQPAIH